MTGAAGTCLNLRISLPPFYNTSTRRDVPRSVSLCEVLSAYPPVNKRIRSAYIWGEVCGKGTRGAACAVHRPPRPSPPLEDKNPFREWNMWETGPPRGIILNYVCPHLSGRRFHLVALRPFVNLARDPGLAILLPFPRFVPDAFFGT